MKIVIKLALFLLAGCAFGQSTSVIAVGTKALTAVGCGSNTGSLSVIEAQAIAAMGCTNDRIGSVTWDQVEIQSAPPNNTGGTYSLPTNGLNDITHAAIAGLTPDVGAWFSPPRHGNMTLTTTSDSAAGTETINVQFTSGVNGTTISALTPWNDYISFSPTLNDTNACRLTCTTGGRDYGGVVVSGVSISGSTAVLTLAAPTTLDLPAGSVITINEFLYSSPATGVVANEPSVRAYAAYAQALGNLCYAIISQHAYDAAYATTGAQRVCNVELWNEPPWGPVFWDNRRDAYLSGTDPGTPGELPYQSVNWGFVDAVQNLSVVAGVHYVWGGTEKAGSNAVLFGTPARMVTYTGNPFTNPNPQNWSQSLHPYGNNPEGAAISQPCIAAGGGSSCNLVSSSTSNFYVVNQYNVLHPPGAPSSMTETGCSANATAGVCPNDTIATRFNSRQFFSESQSVTFMTTYRLYDTSGYISGTFVDTAFSWLNLTTGGTPCGLACSAADGYVPYGSFSSLRQFWIDVAAYKRAPVAITVPTVTSYSGTYPLGQSNFTGGNGYFMAIWQISQTSGSCPTPSVTNPACWNQLASPSPGSAVINIPTGLKIAMARNYTTLAPVAFTVSGSTATFAPTDDVTGILFVPNTVVLRGARGLRGLIL